MVLRRDLSLLTKFLARGQDTPTFGLMRNSDCGAAHSAGASVVNLKEHISGRLRPIVVTALEPSKQLPDVPTSLQAGSPDLLAGNWYGFVAPSATPKDVIEKLNKSIVEALQDPTVQLVWQPLV